MSENIANARRRRRKVERRWRKIKLTVHREAFQEQCQAVKDLIGGEKGHYYNNKFKECDGDQKQLFKLVDKLLSRGKPTYLPQHDTMTDLVNNFVDFFRDKIETIGTNLSYSSHHETT